jgi:hypothetical protein
MATRALTRRISEGAGLTGVLLLAALLFSRGFDVGPNYDEGVYLASDDALDRGERLGEDVFSSQPPGFYLLLRFATALSGDSVDASRTLFLVVAIGGVAGAWALGRALTGAAGGLLAAAALLAAPAYGTESFRVASDSPAVAIALIGLGLLAWSLRWSSPALAVCAGSAIAASVSVKLFAVTALVPAVGLLVAFRPARRVIVGFLLGGAAVTLAFVVAYAGAIGALYDDAVAFHTGAREFEGGLGENAERVATFFHPRTVFTVFVLAGAIAWLVRGARPRLLVPVWLWALASAAFLVWHRPLLDHHFVLLSAACAVAAGATLGGLTLGGLQWSRRTQAVAAVLVVGVLAAGYAQQWRRVGLLAGPNPDVAAAARAVSASTRLDDTIVSDLPIVAHLAERPLPGELVDTSFVRFEAGSLTAACVLAITDEAGARLTVVGRMFRSQPGLLAGIEARFPTRRTIGEIELFERSAASARAAQSRARGSCS